MASRICTHFRQGCAVAPKRWAKPGPRGCASLGSMVHVTVSSRQHIPSIHYFYKKIKGHQGPEGKVEHTGAVAWAASRCACPGLQRPFLLVGAAENQTPRRAGHIKYTRPTWRPHCSTGFPPLARRCLSTTCGEVITPPVRGALTGPPKNQLPRTVRNICRLLAGWLIPAHPASSAIVPQSSSAAHTLYHTRPRNTSRVDSGVGTGYTGGMMITVKANRGERFDNGYPDGKTCCPWCGWESCGCGAISAPDTWAGDLALVACAHRGCGWDHCSIRWVARGPSWNCPWFEPARTEMIDRLS